MRGTLVWKGDLTLDQVRAALELPLPGRAAQLTMALQGRPLSPPPGVEPRQAGVLLLLYPLAGALHLVLTVRTAGLNFHGGQISFPGGGREEGDTSLLDTAVREACEELGVCRDALGVLGPLTPVYVPPSNNLVHPFVACARSRPAFHPDAREVAALLEVPLARLLDPQSRQEEVRVRDGVALRVPFYALGEHKVWGATAIILAEFAALLGTALTSAPPGS
jgi:8-oxo-dGTP pyrophosphatase MutT (NUDIX family)